MTRQSQIGLRPAGPSAQRIEDQQHRLADATLRGGIAEIEPEAGIGRLAAAAAAAGWPINDQLPPIGSPSPSKIANRRAAGSPLPAWAWRHFATAAASQASGGPTPAMRA